jgi:DNA-binding protein YbaB
MGGALAVGSVPTGRTSASVPTRDRTETTQAVQDYAYTQKAALVRNLKKDLAKIQKELDQLSVKVENSSGAVKVDAKAKLKVVRKQWVRAKQRLDQTAGATESTWDEAKDRFRQSYEELKDSLEKTRQWLSDKIGP